MKHASSAGTLSAIIAVIFTILNHFVFHLSFAQTQAKAPVVTVLKIPAGHNQTCP